MTDERDYMPPDLSPDDDDNISASDDDALDVTPEDISPIDVGEGEQAFIPSDIALEGDELFSDDEDLDPTPDGMGLDDIEAAQERQLAIVRDQMQAFEALTLAELVRVFFQAPGETWQMLRAVASTPPTRTPDTPMEARRVAAPYRETVARPRIHLTLEPEFDEPEILDEPEDEEPALDLEQRQEVAALLGVRVVLVFLAWYANSLVAAEGITGHSSGRVAFGGWMLLVLGLAWVAVDVFAYRDQIFVRAELASTNGDVRTSWREKRKVDFDGIMTGIHPVRVVLFIIGVGTLLLTVIFTRDNHFTAIGFFGWMTSIVAFSASLATDRFLFDPTPIDFKIPPFWKSPTFYALLAIIITGAFFRLVNLERTPPQMTSDHVEKLLDSQRVLDGNTQVFFPNNGGREAFQMYAMAVLSLFPNQSIDFTSLKFLSALEGIVTLPFLWWMGRFVVGVENKRLGNIVGLVIAALVAVSSWHVALSRLALRIILTPLMASWLLIYLGRGMRDNNRDEYLKAGLVLGAGLYMYQAVRMLPVVVVIGVFIAVVMRARSWRAWRDYTVNLTSLVFISFVVFVPLFSFSMQYPDLFWRRTAGRLLGDDLVQETLEDGSVIMRDATFGEQLLAFNENLPILGDNIRDALVMFNFKGDVAWINNNPNAPVMDMLVGALFVLGLGAWLVRIVRRRDVVDVLVPVMLFVMLLPSALSIAYPVENPSATRTSGALPVAYLIAAYPLALMLQSVSRLTSRRVIAATLSVVMVGFVMVVSFQQNARTYFQRYHENYLKSSLPYDQAGAELRTFNFGIGSDGNTFMIAYPYWWDHRALGLEAGLVDYPNGVVSLDSLPGFMYEAFLRGTNTHLTQKKTFYSSSQ